MTHLNISNRITPEYIVKLPNKNFIFVYPSNLTGANDKGAAKDAKDRFGATYGRCHGLDNNSYGIPTKDENIKTLPLDRISKYVSNFNEDAKNDEVRTFLVTKIGCGHDGYSPEEIAPMFIDAINLNNVHLPMEFWNVLLQITKKDG